MVRSRKAGRSKPTRELEAAERAINLRLVEVAREAIRTGRAKTIRDRRGDSVQDLADALNLKPVRARHLETGKLAARASLLERYGRYLENRPVGHKTDEPECGRKDLLQRSPGAASGSPATTSRRRGSRPELLLQCSAGLIRRVIVRQRDSDCY